MKRKTCRPTIHPFMHSCDVKMAIAQPVVVAAGFHVHYHPHQYYAKVHKNLASSLLSMAGPARTHTRAHRRRRSADSSIKHYTIARSNNPSAHAPYARTGLLPSFHPSDGAPR